MINPVFELDKNDIMCHWDKITFLEEYKYKIKKEEIKSFIKDDPENSSDDDSEKQEENSEENSE